MGVPTMPAHHARTYATAPHSGTADTVVYCSAARRMVSTLSKPLPILATSSLLVICGVLGALQADEVELGGSLSSFVESRFEQPGKPHELPVLFELHTTNQTLLVVNGITDAGRQEQVLSAAKEWQTTNPNMALVTVRFYRQGGYYHGMGLPPVRIREESIVSSNKPRQRLLGRGLKDK